MAKRKESSTKYTNLTPEKAREMSEKHINWKTVVQTAIDRDVPPATLEGERTALIGISHPHGEPFDAYLVNKIVHILDEMGWECTGNKPHSNFTTEWFFEINW